MSYRVVYDSDMKWGKTIEEWSVRRIVMVFGFLVAFFSVVTLFWTEGKEILFQLLLPGDSVTTWNELQQLTAELRHGVPFSSAFRDFCYEILHSGY